jgi:hypothetical protein|tara:strand:+ start:365 stop:568 length:204 start_codon:yes stop_codon:yes gene_type:complete
MANPKSIALPLAQQEYSSADEAVTRRIMEQAIQDLAIELDKLQKLQSVVVSKGLKRHQFLLMGMKHG